MNAPIAPKTTDQLLAWVEAGLDEEPAPEPTFEPEPPSKWDRIMGVRPLHSEDGR